MIYFKEHQELNCILKFNIVFNEKKLRDLANEIIANCGTRELRKRPVLPNMLKPINYTDKDILSSEDTFLLIHKPNLAKLIISFIEEDDLSLIDYIKFGKFIENDLSIFDFINRKIERIENLSENDISQKELYCAQLELLKESIPYNDDLDLVSSYISKVSDCINLYCIDTYSLDDLKRYKEFFSYNQDLSKIKKI